MEYPIVGWHRIDGKMSSPEVFQHIRESGIDVFMSDETPDAIRRQLDLASAHDLRVLVCDPRFGIPSQSKDWQAQARAALDEYANHPAVFGYHVKDEPKYADMAATAAMTAFLRSEAPDKYAYVNGFGFGGRGAESFFTYAEAYARDIRPQFLSFDAYPVSHIPPKASWSDWYEQDKGYEIPELGAYYRDSYWEAWETWRLMGWKYELPLWGFVLSTPIQHSIWMHGPVTEGTMRLEAFTGLAYGAKATQYFTLPSKCKGGWSEGILALDGSPGRSYEAVRRLNAELHAIGPILAPLECSGVYFTGQITSGCRRFRTLRSPADSSHCPVGRIEGDPVIAAFLKEPGEEPKSFFLMLVNRHPAKASRIEVTLQKGWRAKEIVKSDGSQMAVLPSQYQGSQRPGEEGCFRFLVGLLEGDGRLFRLDAVSP